MCGKSNNYKIIYQISCEHVRARARAWNYRNLFIYEIYLFMKYI